MEVDLLCDFPGGGGHRGFLFLEGAHAKAQRRKGERSDGSGGSVGSWVGVDVVGDGWRG